MSFYAMTREHQYVHMLINNIKRNKLLKCIIALYFSIILQCGHDKYDVEFGTGLTEGKIYRVCKVCHRYESMTKRFGITYDIEGIDNKTYRFELLIDKKGIYVEHAENTCPQILDAYNQLCKTIENT